MVRQARKSAGRMVSIARARPDIVLTDLEMPGKHALVLLYDIRTAEAGIREDTAILVASAYADREQVMQVSNAGANWMLTKPLSFRRLLGASLQGKGIVTQLTGLVPNVSAADLKKTSTIASRTIGPGWPRVSAPEGCRGKKPRRKSPGQLLALRGRINVGRKGLLSAVEQTDVVLPPTSAPDP